MNAKSARPGWDERLNARGATQIRPTGYPDRATKKPVVKRRANGQNPHRERPASLIEGTVAWLVTATIPCAG